MGRPGLIGCLLSGPLLIGSLLIGSLLLGCSPELHQRCDDGAACPNGFYCDGVWCFPDGIGPGPGAGDDEVGPRPDARSDGAPADQGADGAFDALPDVAVDDRGVGLPLALGATEPADGIVSRLVPGRDQVRISLENAETVQWALAADAEAECAAFTGATPLEAGALVIPGEAWADFAPDRAFHVCIRRGPMTRVLRAGPFTVDEVPARLRSFERQRDDAGVRYLLEASEPLSGVQVFNHPRCEARPVEVQVDLPAGRAQTVAGEPLASLGIVLIDAIGNPRPCFEVRLHTLSCHDGAAYTSGNDGIDRGAVTTLASSCPDAIQAVDGELRGACTRCTILLEGERADGVISYDHAELHARRALFAVPRPMTPRPGEITVGALTDAARINQTSFALAQPTSFATWGPVGVRHSDEGLAAPLVVAADVNGDGQPALIVGNHSAPGDVRIVGPDLGAIGQAIRGVQLQRLIRFNPAGMRGDRLLGLTVEGQLIRFTAAGNTFELDHLLEGVSFLAPLPMGGGRQGATFIARANGLDTLYVLLEGEPVPHTLLDRRPRCLTSGDWTRDGATDVIMCEGRGLWIFPLDAQGAPLPANTFERPNLSDSPVVDAVIGRADFDDAADALIVDEAGRLILVTNHPTLPPRVLDVPFRHPRLRSFAAPDAPLDVGLLHPDAAWLLRLRAVDAPEATPQRFTLRLAADEQVRGIGDLNGDESDDVVILSPGLAQVRVLLGGALRPLTRPLALLPEAPAAATAAALGDLTGDGLPDLVAFADQTLSYWYGRRAPPFARFSTRYATNRPIALEAADWRVNGRDDLLVKDGDLLTRFELFSVLGEPSLESQQQQSIPGLIDFEVAELDPTPERELFLRATEAGDDDPLALVLPFAAFGMPLDRVGGIALNQTLVAIQTLTLAGEPHLVFLSGDGVEVDVTLDLDDAVASGAFRGLTTGDLDGDGQTDLLVQLGEPAPGLQRIVRTVDGEFRLGAIEAIPAVDQLFTGDFDGDGWRDVLVIERDPP